MARDADDDKKPAAGGRDQRLKAALRENLRRRKAQARGRAAPAATPEQTPAAADDNER